VQAGVRITVVLGASRSDKQLTQFKLSLLERRQGARTEDKEGKGMWFTYSVQCGQDFGKCLLLRFAVIGT
jgi:hypothetical protein